MTTSKTPTQTTATITSTTCQSLWDKAYPIIIKETEKHPFLVSMVDGTLEENNFRYYVQQDVLYLKDFIYCLRQLSLKKASTTKDKKLLCDLADGAEEVEIALHQSYIKQWNTNGEQQEQEQMPNTLLYTSYMRRIIDGSDTTYGEGLAALLPCFWVYMHVGNCMLKLRDELDKTNNNDSSNQLLRPKHYNDWIDTYAGDEFENDVNNYIQLVNDELQQLKQIEDHFMMACKLEHMFWDQAITMMEWPATTI
ncbi:heme oxygenase-like protein [Fragilariopsis cylindrus CCMP1102]|uniref:Heme oxygenase-like protein n=1 Tax=Fragilariopsis cylindrus CCMP1102 TaxID=635003 RepID=A0A1E7ELV3_9STRA|nr:heme oxygenase-like protein [Fragilariopsis cylindrus CCMP1102]|eukprot:OEU06865.1 heme oxygenase-like protein [Fragilariopsis cylindrus CCMP1102]